MTAAEKIVEVWKLGVSTADIAREMGLSREAVVLVLRTNCPEYNERENSEVNTDYWEKDDREGAFVKEMKKIAFDPTEKTRDRLDALKYLHEEVTGRNNSKAKGPEKTLNVAIAALVQVAREKRAEIQERIMKPEQPRILDVG